MFRSATTIQDRSVLERVEFTDRKWGWMVEDPDRPGCVGYGATEEEARESFVRARNAYDRVKAKRKVSR